MKIGWIAGLYLLVTTCPILATTRYVAAGNPGAEAPYTNWLTAAASIQPAIDAAEAGDEILVGDGVYDTGGVAGYPEGTVLTNRVAIHKPVTLRSLNGAAATIIEGKGPTGDAAVRCVYMVAGAKLEGFTLAHGATGCPPPDYAGLESNDWMGGGAWCSGTGAVIVSCVITGNAAHSSGGGTFRGTVLNSDFRGNTSLSEGGAACLSNLTGCRIVDNHAMNAGGAAGGILTSCTLNGNSASGEFGISAGAAAGATLVGCTVTGNRAPHIGGVYNCNLSNCVVYYNTGRFFDGENVERIGPNCDPNSTLSYSCTFPMHPGTGNITNDPQLASLSHLSGMSPCIGRGSSAALNSPADLDGDLWGQPPSMGCDEFSTATVTGGLDVSILAAYTNVCPGFPIPLTAMIDGVPTSSMWDFGDGATASNRPIIRHAWDAPGDYPLTLTAFNPAHPDGVGATVTVHVQHVVHYVDISNATPAAPHTTWSTAATNIQDAIQAASIPGAVVLVADGIYDSGTAVGFPSAKGGILWRVHIDKPLVVRSVNGAESTIIQGQAEPNLRCVKLTPGSRLEGFTIEGGRSDNYGAGVYCIEDDEDWPVVSRCILRDNIAERGGAAHRCTLMQCLLVDNSAQTGGAAYFSDLINCTLVSNATANAGTFVACSVINSIVWPTAGASTSSTFQNSCTTPLQPGAGNITNDPQFVDLAGGDFHLADGSPCIDVGDNTAVTDAYDLDGNPRLYGGQVDMGAFEWQTMSTVTTTTTTTTTSSTTSTTTTTTTTSSTTAERWKAVLDFDGDGAADLGVYRPANGDWYIRQSTNGQMLADGPVGWVAGGIPVPGDYDGDGLADLATYVASDGTWHILLSSTDALMTGAPVPWGWADTTPVPADYDGDGRTDLAVFWQAGGLWYIRQSRDGNLWSGAPFPFGWADTLPVPADYDGDGQADLAVFYRAGGLWYIRQSRDGALWSGAAFPWGWNTNLPVPGDYDGDGHADLAVYEPSSGHWYVRESSTGATLSGGPIAWGAPAALPVPADYDGDHKTDIAVYVPASGKWYVRQSSNGLLLGGGTDVKGGVSWGHRVVHPILPAYQVLRGQGLAP